MQEGSYGFHGKFDPYGNAQISIVRRALPPVTFALQLDLANGTDSITGTATTSSGGNVLSAALIADRNVFDASKNPAAQAGQYSFVLETLEDGQTFAAGNASVGKSGAVQIHGALNSGSKFSAGSALAKDGNVALFVSVGKGMDVLAGWLNFGGTDESGRGGKVYWVHAASSGVVLLEQATP